MILGVVNPMAALVLLVWFVAGTYVTVMAAVWVWLRWQNRVARRMAAERKIWTARPSRAPVGVGSLRELIHLPAPLQRLVIEAQCIRIALLPLGELRPDSRRALWDWAAAVRQLERRDVECIERLGIRHAALASRLEAAWGPAVNRKVKIKGVVAPAWLHQLMRIDQELWAFIHAARAPTRHAYR